MTPFPFGGRISLILDAWPFVLIGVRLDTRLRKVAVWRLGGAFRGAYGVDDCSISFLYSLSTAGREFLILNQSCF